jgi:hypothetical protein
VCGSVLQSNYKTITSHEHDDSIPDAIGIDGVNPLWRFCFDVVMVCCDGSDGGLVLFSNRECWKCSASTLNRETLVFVRNAWNSTATANFLLNTSRIYRLSYELQTTDEINAWTAQVTTLDGSALALSLDSLTNVQPGSYMSRIFTVIVPADTSAIQLTFTSQGVSACFRPLIPETLGKHGMSSRMCVPYDRVYTVPYAYVQYDTPYTYT